MSSKLLDSNSNLSLKVRVAILIAGTILLIINFFLLDYDPLFSGENLSTAPSMVANLFIIAAMATSIRHTKKQESSK